MSTIGDADAMRVAASGVTVRTTGTTGADTSM